MTRRFHMILLLFSLLTFILTQPALPDSNVVIASDCLSYSDSSKTKCDLCDPKLQLDDSGKCGLYTPILGCAVYKANAVQVCSRCEPGYKI